MPTPKKVTVASKDQLESTITQYVGKGFTVANRSDRSSTMQKRKQFSIPIAIIGFLLCFVGLILYAIWYSMQPDVEVVEIVVV